MIRSLVLMLTFVFTNMSYAATYDEYGIDSPSVYSSDYELIHHYTPNSSNYWIQSRAIHNKHRRLTYRNSYRSHSRPNYGGYESFYGGYANRYNFSYRSVPTYSYQYRRPMYQIERVQREFDLQKQRRNNLRH